MSPNRKVSSTQKPTTPYEKSVDLRDQKSGLKESGDFVLVPREALEWMLERLTLMEEELVRWWESL